MRPSQLENWVLTIYDRIIQGQTVEDSRVELKREWIEPRTAARRIAGHANASRGEHALWIVGLDESTGEVTGRREELANWWQQVEAEFEGGAPGLLNLWVPVDTGGVSALLFDTTRAPYVTRNPVRNQPGAGPIELEVPWRDGTRTRTARRSELMRLLVPMQSLPSIEVLGAGAAAIHADTPDTLAVQCSIALYVVPQLEGTLVIPFHKCSAILASAGLMSPTKALLQLMPEYSLRQRTEREFVHINNSLTVEGTNREVLVRGAGVVEAVLKIYLPIPQIPPRALEPMDVELNLLPAGSEMSVQVKLLLEPIPSPSPETSFAWRLAGDEHPGLHVDIELSSGWRLTRPNR